MAKGKRFETRHLECRYTEYRWSIKGVSRTVGPRSTWWGCVWTDIKTGRITNWSETSRNRSEWKRAIEEVKVQLGL